MLALDLVLGSTTIVALATRALAPGRPKGESACASLSEHEDASLRTAQADAIAEANDLLNVAATTGRIRPERRPSMLRHDGLHVYRREQ